jgi:hypothetical protein
MFGYDSSRWVALGLLLSVREIHLHHASDYLMNPSETVLIDALFNWSLCMKLRFIHSKNLDPHVWCT